MKEFQETILVSSILQGPSGKTMSELFDIWCPLILSLRLGETLTRTERPKPWSPYPKLLLDLKPKLRRFEASALELTPLTLLKHWTHYKQDPKP